MLGLLTGVLNVLPLVIHAIGSAERLKRPGSDKKAAAMDLVDSGLKAAEGIKGSVTGKSNILDDEAVREAVSSLIDAICKVSKVIEPRERSNSTS